MAAHQHRGDLLAVEPARIFEFVGSTTISLDIASAWQPIMSDDGNGQGCEAK